MNQIDTLVVREALKKMFQKSGHFSICDFDKIVEVLGILVPRETRNRLELLHCIDWTDMEPETRTWVASVIDSLFTDPTIFRNNFLPRVLGGKPTALSPSALLFFGDEK